MLRNNQLVGFGAGNGIYTANAWSFGGADDIWNNSVTGFVDSYFGTLSLWFRKDGGDGTSMYLGQFGGFICEFNTDNTIRLRTYDGALNPLIWLSTVTAFTASSTWHHVAISFDTNHAAGAKLVNMYVDGVSNNNFLTDGNPAAKLGNTTAFSTHTGIACAQGNSAPRLTGSLAEVYYQDVSYTDFSVASNLQKFRSVAGKPISLGPTGSLPSGSQPRFYFKNPIATIGTNSGSGGNFTIQGSPTAASSHP